MVCGLILCGMTLLVTTAVVLRYGFGISFQWIEEVSLYGQIAIVMLIAGPLIYRGAHIRVDFVLRKLKGIPLWIISVVNAALCLFVVAFVFEISIGWVQRMRTRGVLTNSGIFEQWMPSMLVPIGFSIATVFAVIVLVKTLAGLKDVIKKDPEE